MAVVRCSAVLQRSVFAVNTQLITRTVQKPQSCPAGFSSSRLPQMERIANAELEVQCLAFHEMAAANRKYRGLQGPTDVLSFPSLDSDELAAPYSAELEDELGVCMVAPQLIAKHAAMDHVDPNFHLAVRAMLLAVMHHVTDLLAACARTRPLPSPRLRARHKE